MSQLCPNKNTLPQTKSEQPITKRPDDIISVTPTELRRKNGTKISRFANLSGKSFNNLTVIEYLGHFNGRIYWKCGCICGREIKVETSNLKRNQVKSCGCTRAANLTGQKFNRLLVRKISRRERGSYFWECLCDCGRACVVRTDLLTSGYTKSCSCLQKETARARRGVLSPHWRADLSKKERLLSKDRSYLPESREWRNKIYIRDNYTCQLSGQRGHRLAAHHLEGWANNKKLRYNLDNGVTLARPIHQLFHKLYGYKNITKVSFLDFKKRYDAGEFTLLLQKKA